MIVTFKENSLCWSRFFSICLNAGDDYFLSFKMSGPETKTWLNHLIFQDFLCQMGERDHNVLVFFTGFTDSEKKTLPVSLIHYPQRRHQWTTCNRREWSVLKDAVNDKILGHKNGLSSALVVPFNANLLPVSVLPSWLNFDKSVKEILRWRPGCKEREKQRERERESTEKRR